MTEDQQKVKGPLVAAEPEHSPVSLTKCYLLSEQRERPPGAQFWLLPLSRLAPECLFSLLRLPPPRT